MIHSKIGYAGVVGALIFSGAFAGCIDNGNDVGFEDGAGGADGADNTSFTAVSTTGQGFGGSGVDGDAGFTNVVTTGSDGVTGLVTGAVNTTVGTTGEGYGGSGEVGNTGTVSTTGSDGFTTVTGTVGTTGEGYGGSTTVGSTGAGYGGSTTVGSTGTVSTTGSDGFTSVTGTVSTTGAGYGGGSTGVNTTVSTTGAPAEAPCGPEELRCEEDEICRVVDTLGSLQYSCVPNPCYDHNQANSCECAASVCGGEAPNCVMIEDDTVVACVCVAC